MKIFFGEVEIGEPVLIHQFHNISDFLEVHSYSLLKIYLR
jgi:hypothetical protein